MHPRIESPPEKKLIGKHLKMSLVNNRTFELWRSFMPERRLIKNAVNNDLFSMQVYDHSYSFKNFNPAAEFEKWAAVEVTGFAEIPEGMETYTINGGLYAVFDYVGPANEGEKIFTYIYKTWLPASEYELDTREHFEILGEKYKNNEPGSEEEIWIPVKRKS
jgi:AraC family transcriptional regulator